MENNFATICFAIIYKNNEDILLKTIESVLPLINNCILLNLGSINNSVEEYFQNKDIPIEIYSDSDNGNMNNKQKLFDICYGKSDFILHLEPGEILHLQNMESLNTFALINRPIMGDLIVQSNSCHAHFKCAKAKKMNAFFDYKAYILYNANVYENVPRICEKTLEYNELAIKTHNKQIIYTKPVLFNNKYKWKIAGNVFQKYIPINIDELDYGYISNKYLYVKNTKSPENGKQNITLLKKEYLDTIHVDEHKTNSLCIFHIAQNYYYLKDWNKALFSYLKYTKLKDADKDELFESYLRIVEIMYYLNYNIKDLVRYTAAATEIYNIRAEPYYILGCIFNENANYDLGYFCLKKAQSKNLDEIYEKAMTYIDESSYNTNINYELAIACLNTERNEEALELLNDLDISKYDKNDIDYLKRKCYEI
jgi:hypothetical protein